MLLRLPPGDAVSGPQCSACERDLPALESVVIHHAAEEFEDVDIISVTFHVRCECGEETGLQMHTEGNEVS